MIFSVVILNYQGERVIEKTLLGLEGQKYNKKDFEVVVVDNNSNDNSKKIILSYKKRSKLNIFFLPLDKNHGFSKGNNFGIKQAVGEFVVLLNNDCVPDKSWLVNLKNAFRSNPKIFAVNSKILLFPEYTSYQIKTNPLTIKNILLTKSKLLEFSKEKTLRLTLDESDSGYKIEIPHYPGEKEISIQIDEKEITLKPKNVYSKIQNAGSLVFQDGYGRDIGAKVKGHTQNYEDDHGQYETRKEVFSTCGAAVAFRKSILDKIGYLDENFFMYYEDTEISERARLMGYINIYEPKASVRHLHAFSSKEWSDFFIYHVERGHLLHMAYHFPAKIFIHQFFIATIKAIKKNIYKKIILWFLINSTNIMSTRLKYQSKYKISRKQLYSSIISGYWYEN